MSSDCEDKRVYLEDILKTDITKYPEWFQKFANTKKAHKELRCGGFKAVYTLDDVAISIEPDRQETPQYYETLKQLPKEYQKHYIYPVETFYTEGDKYTVSKMSNCGDPVFHIELNTALNIPPRPAFFKLNEGHFQELAQALQVLHEHGIAVSDLKGSNIMYCKCDCLAFIDMDSCVTFTGEKRNNEGSMTLYSQPISILKPEDKTKTNFFISDWVAFALLLLNYFGLKLKNLYPDLWNMVIESNNTDDVYYQVFDPSRFDKDNLKKQVQSVLITKSKVHPQIVRICLYLCFYLWIVKDRGKIRYFRLEPTIPLIGKLKQALHLWVSTAVNLKF